MNTKKYIVIVRKGQISMETQWTPRPENTVVHNMKLAVDPGDHFDVICFA
jgi:hypothetical protein